MQSRPLAGSKRSASISGDTERGHCLKRVNKLDVPGRLKTVESEQGSISVHVQPRNEYIGQYSGVKKAMFCITLSASCHVRGVSIKVHSRTGSIHKVLHPNVFRGKHSGSVVVGLASMNGGDSTNILVQLKDVPLYEIALLVTVKCVEPEMGSFQAKCLIKRPPTDHVGVDNPYILAELLRFATSRVLNESRENGGGRKGRIEQVRKMIRNAPDEVKVMPVVQELANVLENA